MQITPRAALHAEQRCLLLAAVGRCSTDELRRFKSRIDRFAEASTPKSPMAGRELLRYGIATREDMLTAVKRHFGPQGVSQTV